MANKDWDLGAIDFYDDECNCEQYKEEEYKRDLKRYLDKADWFEKDNQGYFCNNIMSECKNCLLNNEGYKYHSCINSAFTSFETIKKIFVWAQEHPIITNKDMLKKTFGKDVIHYIEARPYKEEWLEQEYKEPKENKESK